LQSQSNWRNILWMLSRCSSAFLTGS